MYPETYYQQMFNVTFLISNHSSINGLLETITGQLAGVGNAYNRSFVRQNVVWHEVRPSESDQGKLATYPLANNCTIVEGVRMCIVLDSQCPSDTQRVDLCTHSYALDTDVCDRQRVMELLRLQYSHFGSSVFEEFGIRLSEDECIRQWNSTLQYCSLSDFECIELFLNTVSDQNWGSCEYSICREEVVMQARLSIIVPDATLGTIMSQELSQISHINVKSSSIMARANECPVGTQVPTREQCRQWSFYLDVPFSEIISDDYYGCGLRELPEISHDRAIFYGPKTLSVTQTQCDNRFWSSCICIQNRAQAPSPPPGPPLARPPPFDISGYPPALPEGTLVPFPPTAPPPPFVASPPPPIILLRKPVGVAMGTITHNVIARLVCSWILAHLLHVPICTITTFSCRNRNVFISRNPSTWRLSNISAGIRIIR